MRSRPEHRGEDIHDTRPLVKKVLLKGKWKLKAESANVQTEQTDETNTTLTVTCRDGQPQEAVLEKVR